MPKRDIDYTTDIVYPYTQIRVEIALNSGDVESFVVQLEYNFETDPIQPDEWKIVARFDHHPLMEWGHDIRKEGLHMDIYRNEYKLKVARNFPTVTVNAAPAFCEAFFDTNHDRLIDQFERWHGLQGNRYSL